MRFVARLSFCYGTQLAVLYAKTESRLFQTRKIDAAHSICLGLMMFLHEQFIEFDFLEFSISGTCPVWC